MNLSKKVAEACTTVPEMTGDIPATPLFSLMDTLSATAGDVLSAIFVALLYRFTREETIGLLLADTQDSGSRADPHTGFEMVAVGNLENDMPFSRLVEQLRARRQENQSVGPQPDLRISEVVPGLGLIVRDNSAGSVFPEFEPSPVSACRELDLLVIFQIDEQHVHKSLRVRTDVPDDKYLHRLSELVDRLIPVFSKNPEETIGRARLANAKEETTIIDVWNDSYVDLRKDVCLHEPFVEIARKDPDHPAIGTLSCQLSRGDVLRRASAVAAELITLKIGPGDHVAVFSRSRVHQVSALLGTSLAGAAYIPISTDWPADRVAGILKLGNARAILTDNDLVDRLDASPNRSRHVMRIDELALEEAPFANVSVRRCRPDDVAYIIFTSGSTGTPKGVVVAHESSMNCVQGMAHAIGVGGNDTMLAIADLTFDLSVFDIYGMLGQGGTVVFPEPEKSKHPRHWLDLMMKYKITVWHSVPGFVIMLVEAIDAYWSELEDKPEFAQARNSLRLVMMGGDFMPVSLPGRIRKIFPNANVVNFGGVTECSIYSSAHILGATEPEPGQCIPYGRPLPNQKIYIFDDALQHCPSPIPGEMYIAGRGVTKGYIGNDGLNEQKFLTHPVTGEQLYRTGDLARWLPDGNVELIGRLDRQVKIRGFRIELREIEVVLEEYETIGRAVVVVWGTGEGKRLVAYVEPVAGYGKSTFERILLRRHVSRRLPQYMVPDYFIRLERFPLLVNGKVDRRSLPAPGEADLVRADQVVLPRTEAERILAEVWKTVLGVGQIGNNDRFVLLGGDSLLCLAACSRAKDCGLIVEQDEMLRGSLGELAATAVRTDHRSMAEDTPRGDVPLMPIQQYFLGWATANPSHFNVSGLFKLKRRLRTEVLEQAVVRLVQHHDSLRMRFQRLENGRWKQYLVEDPRFLQVPIDIVELSSDDNPALRDEIVRGCVETEAALDIVHGPVMRICRFISPTGDMDHLLLTCHHLVNDGFSFEFLAEDLQAIYLDLENSRPVALPHKTTSYQRFSRTLRDYGRSREVSSELDYWRSMSSDLQCFPVDFVAPETKQGDVDVISFEVLDAPSMARMRERFEASYHARVRDLLTACLAFAAHQRTGQQGLSLHVVGHGRHSLYKGIDVSRTSGWFVTHIPVCVKIARQEPGRPVSFRAVIESTFAQSDAMPNHGLGFGALRVGAQSKIQEELAILDQVTTLVNYIGPAMGGRARSPLFDTPDMNTGNRPDPVDPENPADYLLYVFAYLADGGLRTDICYSTKHYARATIEELGTDFHRNAHCWVHDALP